MRGCALPVTISVPSDLRKCTKQSCLAAETTLPRLYALSNNLCVRRPTLICVSQFGWSSEKMKEKTNIAVVEDSEEMRKWRGFSQSEMGPMLEEFAWKNGRRSPGKYKVEESKRRLQRWRCPPGMEEGTRKQEIQNKEVGEKVAGREFSLCSENTTCSVCNLSRRSQRKKKR